jgi:hypothetical protein
MFECQLLQLNGRQDADAVDRVGVRLRLREAQARSSDIVLYADESEALTHPYLAHAWAQARRRPARCRLRPIPQSGDDGRA